MAQDNLFSTYIVFEAFFDIFSILTRFWRGWGRFWEGLGTVGDGFWESLGRLWIIFGRFFFTFEISATKTSKLKKLEISTTFQNKNEKLQPRKREKQQTTRHVPTIQQPQQLRKREKRHSTWPGGMREAFRRPPEGRTKRAGYILPVPG